MYEIQFILIKSHLLDKTIDMFHVVFEVFPTNLKYKMSNWIPIETNSFGNEKKI